MTELTLIDCLRRFNRKERYWLLRNALGTENNNLYLPLGADFLHKVLNALKIPGFPAREEVWWAMDYHFDWLAGALKLYGRQGIEGIKPELRTKFGETSPTISGSQEDIDFVISFEKYIILIEAKGVTPWSAKQFKSKEERIDLLKKLSRAYDCDVHFEFLLLSPNEPKKLTSQDNLPVHIELLFTERSFFKTTRCDEDGNENMEGGYWTIAEAN